MSCPSCRDGIPVQKTTVGDIDKLCTRHKAEINEWFGGVVAKHDDDDLQSPKDAADRRGGV